MNQVLYTLRYRHYSRRFRVPVKTSRGLSTTREGLIVSLSDSLGNRAETEIAPWEGFGCEPLDEAENVLNALTAQAFPASEKSSLLASLKPLPCTQHALTAAFFLLENPEAKHAPEPPDTAICRLLLRDADASPEGLAAALLADRKHRSFKIKIGLAPLPDEMDFCKKILSRCAELRPDARIRFDANGAWQSPEALTALAPLYAFPQLEFIEQPLAATPENDAAVYALPPEHAAKTALDESLREPWKMPEGTSVVAVVKPLLVGNFPRLRNWLLEAQHAPRFVISSVFETECGRVLLRELCRATRDNPRALAAGIATTDAFEK